MIADSWVNDTIFDNLLDNIPRNVAVRLIYGHKKESFDSRAIRFGKEWDSFLAKELCDLHDRFLIADDAGYVIGPSLKDAAVNSPAIVVRLRQKDSLLLKKFFEQLWLKAV